MLRRLTIALVILAAVASQSSTLPAAPAATEKPARPNILFIMVDDLGKEWISCYGSESIETPIIDKMAAGGMRFNNFYVMPQCTPTRATLLSGQYPYRHGWVNHWDVPRWGSGCHFDWKHYTSFAKRLQQAGYKTAAAGKWQINDFRVQPDAMARHGFDDWCMWTGYESGNPPSAERYWNPYINTPAGSKAHTEKFGADIFTDYLIDFMKQHRDEPMLLYYPMALTHPPLVTTPHDRDAKSPIDRHKAMVRYADHCVGRLLAALDELKIRDNTIVFFTTDNGTSRGITGKIDGRAVPGAKANEVEAGTAAPFIVNCPGVVPAGMATDELADITDMLSTFLDLAGVQLPAGVSDGHSIAPLITGKSNHSEREWILSMGHGAAAFDEHGVRSRMDYFPRVLRDQQYKLWIDGGDGPKFTKLYDMRADRWETKNLIDSQQPEHVAALAKLKAIAAQFPAQDARPKYDPTPAQKWDRHPGWSEKGFQPKRAGKRKKD